MTQIMRMRGEGLELKKYEDVVVFSTADPETVIRHAWDFPYKQGDILLNTYPKTGTHWMANMIWKLKSLDELDRRRDAWMEYDPPETFESQGCPRVLVSHIHPHRLCHDNIENKSGKVVLMMRNPKDTAVSYYHHLKDAILYKNKQTWDEFFQSFIEGEIHNGSYFHYLRQWEQILKDISNDKSQLQVGVFYYEDFILKPKENIIRLNNFLEFERDDEYLGKVLKATTLSALRDRYISNEQLATPFALDEEGQPVIFRKGRVGDWKNQLTVAQSEAIDNLLQENLHQRIIKFKFEL